MTFKILSYVMTFAGSALGLRFIFAGSSVLKQWGIEVADGPLILGRRIGALYLGLALLFFLGRAAGPSELRSAVCLGMSLASALLAGLGFLERSVGRVSSGIVVPALIEAALAVAFAWVGWSGR